MTQYKPGDHVHVTIPGKAEFDVSLLCPDEQATDWWCLADDHGKALGVSVYEGLFELIQPTYPPCPCGKPGLLSGKSGLVECECGNRLDPDTWTRVFGKRETCKWRFDASDSFLPFRCPHYYKWYADYPGTTCPTCGLPVEIVS